MDVLDIAVLFRADIISHIPRRSFGHTCHMENKCIAWFSNGDAFIDLIPEFAEVDHYIMRWRGEFRADETGFHGFQLASDDGSRLYVDGKLIVDNDGDHGTVTVAANMMLQAGWHPIVIT
jgi:hypothetical protein